MKERVLGILFYAIGFIGLFIVYLIAIDTFSRWIAGEGY